MAYIGRHWDFLPQSILRLQLQIYGTLYIHVILQTYVDLLNSPMGPSHRYRKTQQMNLTNGSEEEAVIAADQIVCTC